MSQLLAMTSLPRVNVHDQVPTISNLHTRHSFRPCVGRQSSSRPKISTQHDQIPREALMDPLCPTQAVVLGGYQGHALSPSQQPSHNWSRAEISLEPCVNGGDGTAVQSSPCTNAACHRSLQPTAHFVWQAVYTAARCDCINQHCFVTPAPGPVDVPVYLCADTNRRASHMSRVQRTAAHQHEPETV